MAITKLTTDLDNIQGLSDKPNEIDGLTADQLKALFDKAGEDIKTYLNSTLTDELDTLHGSVTSADLTKLHALTADATELNYIDGATSAIQTQLNTKKLYSKVIEATRDGTASSGDVSYTGVGFLPTSITCLMVVDGTLYKSDGVADSGSVGRCIYQSAANTLHNGSSLVSYTNYSSWAQNASIKSYDADGFTLTWTKNGSPTGNTLALIFICYK